MKISLFGLNGIQTYKIMFLAYVGKLSGLFRMKNQSFRRFRHFRDFRVFILKQSQLKKLENTESLENLIWVLSSTRTDRLFQNLSRSWIWPEIFSAKNKVYMADSVLLVFRALKSYIFHIKVESCWVWLKRSKVFKDLKICGFSGFLLLAIDPIWIELNWILYLPLA